MASSPNSIQIPAPTVPFLNPDGSVSKTWFYFLLTLMNRTGGVPGGSTIDLQNQIYTLSVEIAEADIPMSEPQPNPIPLSVDSIWPTDAEPARIDPVIAALMTSDVT